MSALTRPARRLVGRVLRSSKAFRDVTKRLDRAEARLARTNEDLARERQRLTEQCAKQERAATKRIERLETAMAPLAEFLRPVEQTHKMRELDQQRLLSQVAVFEERLGRLEQLSSTPVAGQDPLTDDATDVAQARALLEDVRAEHERIRARMQVIAWYEERLRRVESSVAELYSGDARHPV